MEYLAHSRYFQRRKRGGGFYRLARAGLLCLCLFLPLACDDGRTWPETEELGNDGGKLTLMFDLHPGANGTRGNQLGAQPSELLPAGTLFRVYGYKVDAATEVENYADEGIYEVKADGTAHPQKAADGMADKDPLRLSRGVHHLYFVSLGSDADLPAVPGSSPDKTVIVPNKADFLATSMENVLIQSNQDGQKEFTVLLSGSPFRHLCSRVKVTLQVPDHQPGKPVKVSKLRIGMTHPYLSGRYALGGTAFASLVEGTAGDAGQRKLDFFSSASDDELDIVEGTTDAASVLESRTLFPVLPFGDVSKKLEFDVSMTVDYRTPSGGNATIEITPAHLLLGKTLLPGKSYNFIFTLSFYGDYLATDLTLDVKEYIPVELRPGDVGGDD